MFLALSHNLPQLVKAIIRPPRAEYDVLELGPERFEYGGVLHVREDSDFINARGLKLQCSMWRRADLDGPAPCVVYSHGNASCRAEALQILAPVLASGASVFSFDFAGCGQSEGEYISLGWYEKDDLQAAVEQLRSPPKTGRAHRHCCTARPPTGVLAARFRSAPGTTRFL